MNRSFATGLREIHGRFAAKNLILVVIFDYVFVVWCFFIPYVIYN